MTIPIIEEVRRIRNEIESENHNDWDTIEEYLSEKQAEITYDTPPGDRHS